MAASMRSYPPNKGTEKRLCLPSVVQLWNSRLSRSVLVRENSLCLNCYMDFSLALRSIFSADHKRLRILSQVRSLELPDCWIGAGFVRNAVWDHLHARPCSSLSSDVDVIWFDPSRSDRSLDQDLEARLRTLDSSIDWQVKNQGRMHARNGDVPYVSTVDALRYFPETATAVAVREGEWGDLEFAAPYGFDDLFALVVRPTPRFQFERYPYFLNRVHGKQWLETWPRLQLAD